MQLPYAVRCLSLSTQRGQLAVGGFGNEVGIWDLHKRDWLFKFSCSCGDQRCKVLSSGRQVAVWRPRRRRSRLGYHFGTGSLPMFPSIAIVCIQRHSLPTGGRDQRR